MNLLFGKEKSKIAPYLNPFGKDCFQNAHIFIRKKQYGPRRGTIVVSGSIEFKNGGTEGKQRFDADDFEGLIAKMKAFIDEL